MKNRAPLRTRPLFLSLSSSLHQRRRNKGGGGENSFPVNLLNGGENGDELSPLSHVPGNEFNRGIVGFFLLQFSPLYGFKNSKLQILLLGSRSRNIFLEKKSGTFSFSFFVFSAGNFLLLLFSSSCGDWIYVSQCAIMCLRRTAVGGKGERVPKEEEEEKTNTKISAVWVT